jgi:anti-sigma factor RsiW
MTSIWQRIRSGGQPGLTCVELVELVTDYLEGALSPSEHDRVERHLGACENCTRYV